MTVPSKQDVNETLGQSLAHVAQTLAQTRNARRAPRCEVVKPSGQRCGSPALRGHSLCWQHREQLVRPPRGPRRRIQNGTQAALDYVLAELWAGRMDHKVAGTLLYGLQSVVATTSRARRAGVVAG